MKSKRIIFLDVSGSIVYYKELWNIAKETLKSHLALDKKSDTYVCLFSAEVKLLNEKELQEVLNRKDDTYGILENCGTRTSAILQFFPIDFVNNAEIEVLSDFEFEDESYPKSLMQKSWEHAKVSFFNLREELEISRLKKEQEKKTQVFEPTIKAERQIQKTKKKTNKKK